MPEPFSQLEPELRQAVQSMGLSTQTSIQRASFEPASQGRDLIAVAMTGSGKTLAYLLPLLQTWIQAKRDNKPSVLIVLPTRELVQQVAQELHSLCIALPWLKSVRLHGGVSINPQLKALRGGADFILATPGRLLDVIEHRGLKPSRISHLVLDEADRLLGEGFAEQIEQLLSRIKPTQTLMFTATFPDKLQRLTTRTLSSPFIIDEAQAVKDLVHCAIEVDRSARRKALIHLLQAPNIFQALIFTARHREADSLAADLVSESLAASAFHAKLSQAKRNQVMGAFRSGQLRFLVSTDLASRGIDVPNLPIVINFDLPRSAQDYIHRAGRSARAGKAGKVISLVDADSRSHLAIIEKRCALTITRERMEAFPPVDLPSARTLVGENNGGIKGRRPSKKDRLRAVQKKDDHVGE